MALKDNAPTQQGEHEGDGELSHGGGKNKKKLIFLAVGVVVLVALMAGGYFFFIGSGDAKDKKEAEHAETTEEHGTEAAHGDAGHGEGAAGEAPPVPGVVFYDLPDFVVNLNDKGSKTHFLKLSVTLELPDQEALKIVDQMRPRIMDSFQVYLRELRKSDLEGSAGIYRLREELLLRVNKTVFPAKVNDILFKEMITQ